MKLLPENIYHIYNRGNNKQLIFFNRYNYLFFLKKVRIHIFPLFDILAYCLMPNHFHFLIFTSSQRDMKLFSKKYKILLSSYTRAINKQKNRTGSLFQQNSKAKCLSYETSSLNNCDYAVVCFNYIHQNPLLAGLVKKLEDWEFSSFSDYMNRRNDTICNKKLAFDLLNLPQETDNLYNFSYSNIAVETIDSIY